MNSISLTGRLGQNPELRYTQTEKPVCNLSVANTTGFGDNRQTHWFTVVCWQGQAEAVAQYLHKGSHVAVTGRLVTRKWEDQDGKNRVNTEIIANTVDFLDPSAPKDMIPPEQIPGDSNGSATQMNNEIPF